MKTKARLAAVAALIKTQMEQEPWEEQRKEGSHRQQDAVVLLGGAGALSALALGFTRAAFSTHTAHRKPIYQSYCKLRSFRGLYLAVTQIKPNPPEGKRVKL